jgi:uncharacterized protein YjbI with pentapeptide repeats
VFNYHYALKDNKTMLIIAIALFSLIIANNLSSADLNKVDPIKIDLTSKYLYQENLDRLDLSRLNFSGAKLYEVSLKETIFIKD